MHGSRTARTTLFFAGCTTHGLIPPLAIEPGQAAMLTVIRRSALLGAAGTTIISLDHEDLLGIRNGEHVTVSVPAGERLIGAECGPVGGLKYVRLRMHPGRHYYVHVTPAGACPPVELSEADATRLIAETKPSS